MADCIFCKIIAGQIPAKIVYQDDHAVAIEDINPQAPVHLLVMPRKHLPSLNDMAAGDEPLLGHLFAVSSQLAQSHQIEKGYRTVINNGAPAGQSVFHLHIHVIGGRAFNWPPG